MAPIPHVHKKKKDDADTIRRYMSGGSAGVPDLTGYAQESWVGDNFVTKEFFRSMFKAYDSHGVEILPNNDGDEPSVIDNIKAMVGLWTNEYISALGQGSGGGGGGGSTSLAGLTDVAINPQTLAGGQALIYNGTTHKWENGSAVINMASVWSALGASTNEQINASHLSAALQGFATETWVSQNYISIAYFDRLFRAYNGDNLVNHNDEETTITNIEAMFGFWTKQYISALGNSGGGSVSLTLANMGDVSLNNLADGQVLTYNGTTSKWINSGLKTINGQSIYGSGNIEVGGGASGNYLPLSGGTLTNSNFRSQLEILRSGSTNDSVIAFSNASGLLGCLGFRGADAKPAVWYGSSGGGIRLATVEDLDDYIPLSGGIMTGNLILQQGVYIQSGGYALLVYNPLSGVTGVTSSQWGAGASNCQGVIRSNANNLLHYRGGSGAASYAILDEYNATTILNGSYLPLTGGSVSGNITPSANASYNLGSSSLWWNRIYTRYLDSASGYNLRLCAAGTEQMTITTSGNVGIGTTSPNYKLHVNGTLGAGNTSVANLESEGYVSALSDIRKKKVVEYMDGLTIEQIASMPIIKFTWRDRPEEGLQVGSVAQEWQKILPQSVHTTHDGFLSFAESRAALVGTISNSRELMKHDARLSRIEKLLNINID